LKLQGTVLWAAKRFRTLGEQNLPDKLLLDGPAQVAAWAGELDDWLQALNRYKFMLLKWPVLDSVLHLKYNYLAQMPQSDFDRLISLLEWLESNPQSQLYPRQLPIAGLDSKWLETHTDLAGNLVGALLSRPDDDKDFYSRCGLKKLPFEARLRLLDPKLRRIVGGLENITAPIEQLISLQIAPSLVIIVENRQTGLAFGDLPGAVLFMGHGKGISFLSRLPWLKDVRSLYWGDIDTHGLAILSVARSHLKGLESVLMDERTLLSHKDLWGAESKQHGALESAHLTQPEQTLYSNLKNDCWGHKVRLEQERIDWSLAWPLFERLSVE
jgi:hypothetical protein